VTVASYLVQEDHVSRVSLGNVPGSLLLFPGGDDPRDDHGNGSGGGHGQQPPVPPGKDKGSTEPARKKPPQWWPRRRPYPEPIPIPQQVIDDLASLYRTVYAGRQFLDSQTLQSVADLAGFFVADWRGGLPAPEDVHFRDLAEYPHIDLSALAFAADLIIATGGTAQQVTPPAPGESSPAWVIAAMAQGEAAERAKRRLAADTARAARLAKAQAEYEEEEALMTILAML
jgi:hypothetical protein